MCKWKKILYNSTKNGNFKEQVVVKARCRCKSMAGDGVRKGDSNVIKHLAYQVKKFRYFPEDNEQLLRILDKECHHYINIYIGHSHTVHD